MKMGLCALLAICIAGASSAMGRAPSSEKGGYLFATFKGEATPMTEQIYFMVSENGRDWEALNNGEPVLVSTVGEKGVRDPYIMRSHDGSKFYMIATDLSINLNGDWWRAQSAASKSIVIWESEDLVNWSEPRLVKVAADDAGCTWAPEAVYDEERGEYMVFWASLTARDNFSKQRIWAARTKDFKTFSEPFIYIEKPTTVIDTTIIRENDTYYRFTKDEQYKAITMEESKDLMSGWKDVEGFSLAQLKGYEGPTCFMTEPAKDGQPAKWTLLLDQYSTGAGYQPFDTDDLGSGNFVAGSAMNFPFHPVRHGTVLPITGAEMSRLVNKWGSLELKTTSDQVKPLNMVIDRAVGTVELPVKAGTDLTKLDPQFEGGFGMKVSPEGAQDFSKGPVEYQIGQYSLQVSAVENHNPVLAGYYADPDCIYSHKTGKFYIYPTSDGFDGWSGTYFKTFSSPDLVHWTDEGVILDLPKDLTWANGNAWAPCIIEKKIGNDYKYFYYFSGGQNGGEKKIGVATSDSPTGPFVDSGKPLIDYLPPGAGGGQQIDADVFHDPESGKDYLYWGNGYMAVAELNEDMISLDKSTIKVITPDHTYREGTHVFYRNGIYYLLWSEDDTGSPNYRVRYAMAKSPMGPFTIPDYNLVIARNDSAGILGTGHNSTIQVPGKDEWYIVYHRINYPDAINQPGPGFHREVCIDKMQFDENGLIIPVQPTHEGIEPVK